MATLITNFLSFFLGKTSTGQALGVQPSGPAVVSTPTAVTEDSAMRESAVYYCIMLLVGTLSRLPLSALKLDGTQWVALKPDEDRRMDALMYLLTVRPNLWQDSQSFWDTLAFYLVQHGNAYVHTPRRPDGSVVSLSVVAKTQVAKSVLKDGTRTYHFWSPDRGGQWVSVPWEEVWHVHGPGNGDIGMSVFEYSSQSVSMAQAATAYGAQFFQSATPGGVVYVDKLLGPEQRDTLMASIDKRLSKPHALLPLELGMKYERIQQNPAELQLLDTRKHSVDDIARFYGVPSALAGGASTTVLGSSVEQIFQSFHNLTIAPHSARILSSARASLLSVADSRRYKFHHDFEALTPADMKSRGEFYKGLVSGGLMTPNEGRTKLGMPTHSDDNADSLILQSGMSPLAEIQGPASAPPPSPPGAAPGLPPPAKPATLGPIPSLKLDAWKLD